MIRRISAVVVALVLSACGSDAPKPAELEPITASAEIVTGWKESISKSENYVFTPAIVGDSVYAAGGKGDVMRIDNGVVRWKTSVATMLSGGVGSDGRLVLVGSSKGEIIALDAETGKEQWKAQVTSEVLSAPAVSGRIVVVRSGDNRIYAFNSADGKRLWVYQRQTPALSLRTYAPPLIDNNYVFAGFPGGKLVAVTLNNGALAWEGTVAIPKGTTELDRIADITTAPVLTGRQICAVAFQGRVACFDLNTGNLAWSRDISSSSGLSADNRYLYVTDDRGAVSALDLRSGASVWKQDKLLRRQVSAPAAQGDYVAVGDIAGVVHLINRENGAFVARLKTDGSPISAPVQVQGNRFVVQTRNGSLLGLEIR